MSIAFSLRAEYEGTLEGSDTPVFDGGHMSVGTNRSFHLGQALAAGNGQIVVDDTDEALIYALDNQPAFKRVAAKGAEPTVDQYGSMSSAQLKELIKARALEGIGPSKDEMRAALHASDHPEQEA